MGHWLWCLLEVTWGTWWLDQVMVNMILHVCTVLWVHDCGKHLQLQSFLSVNIFYSVRNSQLIKLSCTCTYIRYMYIWSPSTNLSAYVHSKQTTSEFILRALGIFVLEVKLQDCKSETELSRHVMSDCCLYLVMRYFWESKGRCITKIIMLDGQSTQVAPQRGGLAYYQRCNS